MFKKHLLLNFHILINQLVRYARVVDHLGL